MISLKLARLPILKVLFFLVAGVVQGKSHVQPAAANFRLPEKFLEDCDRHGDHRNQAAKEEHRLNPKNVERYLQQSKDAKDFFLRIDRDSHLLGKSDDSRIWGNFALMWKSQSAQRAAVSPKYPRMIFLRDGAIIAATHSPDPKHKKINEEPEMIWFDPEQKHFRFFSIQFQGPKKALVEIPRSDPEGRCSSCHGEDMRPIWTSYRTWPGAYLSAEADFLDVYNPKDDFYGQLGRTWYGENAAGLNGYLNLYNFKRIAKLLQANRAVYSKLKYALMGAILECPDLPSFLGEKDSPQRKEHEARLNESYQDSLQKVAKSVDDFYSYLQSYAESIGDEAALKQGNRELNDIIRMAGIRYLFEGYGVKTGYFSLSRRKGQNTEGYGFHRLGGDSNGLRSITCELLPDMVREDQRMIPLLDLDHSVGPNITRDKEQCGMLKKLSLEAVQGGIL